MLNDVSKKTSVAVKDQHPVAPKSKVVRVHGDKEYLLRLNNENNVTKTDTLVIIPNRYEKSDVPESYADINKLSNTKLIEITSHVEAQKTMNTFLNTLETNKKNLMSDLKLTENEYYRLVNIAMGIAEHETHFEDNTFITPTGEKRTQTRLGIKQILAAISSECSQGLTQIKYKSNFKENSINKKIADKYGITSAKDYRDDASKCALATMIILADHLRTAESELWQTRLKNNNAKIDNKEEQITTDDIIALLWNGTGKVDERFDAPEDVVKITDRNTAPEWKVQLHLESKDGMSYPRYVRYYRKNLFGGKIQ